MNIDFLALARWAHYVAGVMWIGHLWFFNFVNINYQTEVPADLKKTVNPPLMLRALFFFRWGAMFTFLTGIYMLSLLWGKPEVWANSGIKGWYMGIGAVAGTIMFINVWGIIWRAQKKIIGAMQGGPAADPKLAPRAAMASKVNTYLSVPMLAGMMCGAHGGFYPFGDSMGALVLTMAIGLGLVWLGYKFSPKVSSKIFKAA